MSNPEAAEDYENLDYDLFVIDPKNDKTSLVQLRDCIYHAIKELDRRTGKAKGVKQEAHAIQPEEKKKSRYSLDFNEIDAKLAECTTVDEVNKYADELLAKKLTVNQRAAIKEKIYDRRRAIIILENM